MKTKQYTKARYVWIMEVLLDADRQLKREKRKKSNRESNARWRKKAKSMGSKGLLDPAVVERRKQQKRLSQNRRRRDKKAAKEAEEDLKQKEQSEAAQSAMKVTLNSHPLSTCQPYRD